MTKHEQEIIADFLCAAEILWQLVMQQKLTDMPGVKNILIYFPLGERELINDIIDTAPVESDSPLEDIKEAGFGLWCSNICSKIGLGTLILPQDLCNDKTANLDSGERRSF